MTWEGVRHDSLTFTTTNLGSKLWVGNLNTGTDTMTNTNTNANTNANTDTSPHIRIQARVHTHSQLQVQHQAHNSTWLQEKRDERFRQIMRFIECRPLQWTNHIDIDGGELVCLRHWDQGWPPPAPSQTPTSLPSHQLTCTPRPASNLPAQYYQASIERQ